MRVAIPVSYGWVERVFDCANMIMIFDFSNGRRGEYFETALRSGSKDCCARELSAMGIDVLICNEISRTLESAIRSCGIEVLSRRSGRVDEVIEDLVGEVRDGGIARRERSEAQAAVS
jgi:predicted Fe-Mo cluster-binding NifX family protein